MSVKVRREGDGGVTTELGFEVVWDLVGRKKSGGSMSESFSVASRLDLERLELTSVRDRQTFRSKRSSRALSLLLSLPPRPHFLRSSCLRGKARKARTLPSAARSTSSREEPSEGSIALLGISKLVGPIAPHLVSFTI